MLKLKDLQGVVPAPTYWPALPENGPPPLTPAEVGLPDTFAPTAHIRSVNGRVAQLWMQAGNAFAEERAVWVDIETARPV